MKGCPTLPMHTGPMHNTHQNPQFRGVRNEEVGLSDLEKIRNARACFIPGQLWARSEHIETFDVYSFDEAWSEDAEGDVGAYRDIWDRSGQLKDRAGPGRPAGDPRGAPAVAVWSHPHRIRMERQPLPLVVAGNGNHF